MYKFEGQPKNIGQPEALRFTSWHTAEFGDEQYNVRKIIELSKDLPVSETLIGTLEKMKPGKYWHDKKGEWIGPEEILSLYKQAEGVWQTMINLKPDYVDHIRAVEQADYEKRPIVLVGSADNYWVLDGMHRLTKAWIDQVVNIKTQRFEKLPQEAVISRPETK